MKKDQDFTNRCGKLTTAFHEDYMMRTVVFAETKLYYHLKEFILSKSIKWSNWLIDLSMSLYVSVDC